MGVGCVVRTEIPIVVMDNTGRPIQNASATIYLRGTTNAAAIYQTATGISTFSNPIATDVVGRVSGWLERGQYDCVIAAAGLTTYTEPYDSTPAGDGGIDTAWLADSAITGAKIAALAIASAHLQDGAVTGAKIVAGLVPAFTSGPRSARPTAAAAGAGGTYYASDQDAVHFSTGVGWLRLGPQAGDIVWTAETAARTGYVLLQGQAWPSTTGPYADLFGKWGGANLPDVQGRMFAAMGSHADVATLLNNEGVASVANRRPKHRTSNSLSASSDSQGNHSHAQTMYSGPGGSTVVGTAGGASDSTGNGSQTGAAGAHSHNISIGGSIGTNVGTDPLDASAYVVLQPQAKL
jgi:hypothetical protein